MNWIPQRIYHLCKVTSTFLLLFSTLSVCGQAPNNTVSIYNAKGDTMYSDKSNAVAVWIDKVSRDKLLVTVSQGRAFSSDQQLFTIDSLRNGTVEVFAFRIESEKKVLLARKKYVVVTSPAKLAYDKYGRNHGFNLAGYSNRGKIPLSDSRPLIELDWQKG